MKSPVLGAVNAVLFTFVTVSANAELVGRLQAIPGGTDYQAYYDDQLDITWTADANINGLKTWDHHVDWAAALTVNGIGGWRLPSMDVNGDDVIVNCSMPSTTQAVCKDNEYGHLYLYGAGTTLRSGVAPASPGPFTDVQPNFHWSGTEFAADPSTAFVFSVGIQLAGDKNVPFVAWAVHSGDVSAVPVPAAVWLFGSGLLGLIGIGRRKKA
jgi:hypothetical protein